MSSVLRARIFSYPGAGERKLFICLKIFILVGNDLRSVRWILVSVNTESGFAGGKVLFSAQKSASL